MLSDEEKKAINNLNFIIVTDIYDNEVRIDKTKIINEYNESVGIVLNLIRKQSKEIEELKETLKCTQNSWFEDTQKIEEMKKQLDLDNECEIALNSKIMDLEKEIEELKERYERANKRYLKSLQEKDDKCEKLLEYVETEKETDYISKDKIKAKIEDILNSENSEAIEKLIEWQSLLEKDGE